MRHRWCFVTAAARIFRDRRGHGAERLRSRGPTIWSRMCRAISSPCLQVARQLARCARQASRRSTRRGPKPEVHASARHAYDAELAAELRSRLLARKVQSPRPSATQTCIIIRVAVAIWQATSSNPGRRQGGLADQCEWAASPRARGRLPSPSSTNLARPSKSVWLLEPSIYRGPCWKGTSAAVRRRQQDSRGCRR